MPIAAAVPAMIGLGGQVAGGLLGSKASKGASAAQQQAVNAAIGNWNTMGGKAENALLGAQGTVGDIQSQMYGAGMGALNPYQQAGYGALSEMINRPDFAAPTEQQMLNEPGYQAGLNEGMRALQNSIAANTGNLSGAAVKEAMRYGQDYASQKYGDVYNRALQTYNTNYNKLSDLINAGYGATTQGVNLGTIYGNQAQQNYGGTAQNLSGLYQNQAQSVADLMTQGGNAAAAGKIGSANAWANQIPGITNTAYSVVDLLKNRKPKSTVINL